MTPRTLGVCLTLLALTLAWRFWPVRDMTAQTTVQRDALAWAPADPTLAERIEILLASEHVRTTPTTEGPDSSELESIAPKGAWTDIPRVAEDFVWLVSNRPADAVLRRVLRQHQLNRNDTPIDSETWRAAAQRLDPLAAKLDALLRLESETADKEMRTLVDLAAVPGTALEVLSSEEGTTRRVPSNYLAQCGAVYSIHMRGDRGYVFSLAQLPQTTGVAQLRNALMCEYGAAVLEFFLSQGTLSSGDWDALMGKLFSASDTSPQRRKKY